MGYAKIKRGYSAVFTHTKNIPLRPTLSRVYIQAAGQIDSMRKGEKTASAVEETTKSTGMQFGNTLKLPPKF